MSNHSESMLVARELTKVYRMGEVDVHALRGVQGQAVIAHPSDRVAAGVKVSVRDDSMNGADLP